MPEHFSKSTMLAKFWCKKHGRPTMHWVHDGRRGACQECVQELEAKAALPKPPAPAKQELLFEESLGA